MHVPQYVLLVVDIDAAYIRNMQNASCCRTTKLENPPHQPSSVAGLHLLSLMTIMRQDTSSKVAILRDMATTLANVACHLL